MDPFPRAFSLLSEKKAVFSQDRLYRYALLREFSLQPDLTPARGWWDKYVMFIGLNPSTADETINDNTVSRCIAFAQRWGYRAMVMMNIFAYRSTDPVGLLTIADPVGPLSNAWLRVMHNHASLSVACWGAYEPAQERARAVMKLLPGLSCLGRNQGGSPRHPLYLPKKTVLEKLPSIKEDEYVE